MTPPVRITLILSVLVMLAGCTQGLGDLRTWVAQEKAKKGVPLPPVPAIKTFETFTYNDQNLRDPFSPSSLEITQRGNTNSPRPDADRPRQPLEAFPLSALKLVGTIGSGANIQALVMDPMGVIHRVTRNQYMGQNDGRVSKITPGHVDLVELIPNGNGGWMEHKAVVAMSEQ